MNSSGSLFNRGWREEEEGEEEEGRGGERNPEK